MYIAVSHASRDLDLLRDADVIELDADQPWLCPECFNPYSKEGIESELVACVPNCLNLAAKICFCRFCSILICTPRPSGFVLRRIQISSTSHYWPLAHRFGLPKVSIGEGGIR